MSTGQSGTIREGHRNSAVALVRFKLSKKTPDNKMAKLRSFILLTMVLAGFPFPARAQQVDRAGFFEDLSQVKLQMGSETVAEILGRPDRVTTNGFRGETWHYGTTVNAKLSSLGQVKFDSVGNVQVVFGNTGIPIKLKNMGEAELRQCMELIFATPTLDGNNFNPHKLIEVVNLFQPLGQNTAFAIFREYERVSCDDHGRQRIYLLLRCLHEAPESPSCLPVLAGDPLPFSDIAVSDCAARFPRFPVSFLCDVPVLHTIDGYFGSGVSRPLATHMKQYENKFPWIRKPLPVSEASEEELAAALGDFRKSRDWYFPDKPWNLGTRNTEDIYQMFAAQLNRFLKTRESSHEE